MAQETWKCCVCDKTFTYQHITPIGFGYDERQGNSIFGMTCCKDCEGTEAAEKLYNDIYEAELPEHMHQERQWEAYRNDWPIYDDPDEQFESNQQRRSVG